MIQGCVSCLSKQRYLILDKGTLSLYRCLECGLIYKDDWSESFDVDMYDYYKARHGLSKEEIYNPINARRNTEFLEQFQHIKGRLLDVGCGEGQLVHDALNLGWKAQGIDLSESAIVSCRLLGLPCEKTDFFDRGLEEKKFDMIVMSELIEHVPKPGLFLERAEKLLNKNGFLYLTTPNFLSLTRRCMGKDWHPIHPEHFSYFTPASIKYILKSQTNLKIVSVKSRNVDLYGIKNKLFPVKQRPQMASQLREEIEASPVLKSIKKLINSVLNITKTGDTLTVLCQRVSE